MNGWRIAGLTSGTIIGIGGAYSPVGDIPFLIVLGLKGVMNPAKCLGWIKIPTDVPFTLLHPCYPIIDPSRLEAVINFLVFIAIFLILWGGIELLGKIR